MLNYYEVKLIDSNISRETLCKSKADDLWKRTSIVIMILYIDNLIKCEKKIMRGICEPCSVSDSRPGSSPEEKIRYKYYRKV